jgi:hypothetical protein
MMKEMEDFSRDESGHINVFITEPELMRST